MTAKAAPDQLVTTAALRLEKLTKLVTLADKQQAMLLESKHSDLEENLREHELTLAELAQLNRQEEALMGQPDVAGDTATLRGGGHEAIARDTTDTCRRLSSLVQCNAQLLDNAMQYVDFSLGILTSLFTGERPYDLKSDGAANSPAIMLDTKA